MIHSREQAFNIEYILVENRARIDVFLKTQARSETQKLEIEACYYRIMRDIKIIHAKYQYKKEKFEKSLMNLIAAYRIDELYRYFREKELLYEPDKEKLQEEKDQLFLNQYNILADIMQLLLKMKKYTLSLELALFLNWVDTVCNIYEAQIQDENRRKKKLNLKRIR